MSIISSRKANPNSTKNCGGNKKAGLAGSVGHSIPNINAIRRRANPGPGAPFPISSTNQLRSMFSSNAGGVNMAAINRAQKQCQYNMRSWVN